MPVRGNGNWKGHLSIKIALGFGDLLFLVADALLALGDLFILLR